ncbi:uncharacterized protein [Pagrus major]|uniref:uncharacterized protein n=1 Tax=Pagrus major TaxID=143350 RepID=UPI003CC87794
METIFLMLLGLLGGLRETEALSVTGVLGETVKIKCTHANAFSNVKYFCKGKCRNEDILISSRKEKKDSNGRYKISDEGNTFDVTISHLTEADSGRYWCGIDRFGLDTYQEVILTVREGNKKEPENDLSDTPQSNSNEEVNPKASSSKKLVYIGAGLGVVLLALVIVLVIFFRHRSRNVSASSGKVQDTVYATPLCQKQDANHITTSSSTATEDQETGGRTNSILSSSSVRHQLTSKGHDDNIYSNVNVSLESQMQPDGLVYSTVSFNKHCSSVTPRPAVVTYSTINNISTDESTVYCNV